jgi:calcium-dependent protein kinase
LKLIDFGFSKVTNPSIKMRQCLGTMSYVAPEVLQGDGYGSECDMWSLGVITFILLAGYMPFHGNEEQQANAIMNGEYEWLSNRWSHVSEQGKRFTKGLLCIEPQRRLTAQIALKDPWIKGRCKHKEGGHTDRNVVQGLRKFANSSKFRRCCLEMMAWSLSSEEIAKVQEDFRSIDTNCSGTITLTELRDLLVRKYKIADDEATQVFNALDTNSDEEIHYSDFLAAMLTTRIALHDDLLRQAFKRFDTDRSGFITIENLREVLGDYCKGQQVTEMLAEVDKDKTGRISYEEFVSYLEQHPDEAQAVGVDHVIDHEIQNQHADLRQKVRGQLTLARRKTIMAGRAIRRKMSSAAELAAQHSPKHASRRINEMNALQARRQVNSLRSEDVHFTQKQPKQCCIVS